MAPVNVLLDRYRALLLGVVVAGLFTYLPGFFLLPEESWLQSWFYLLILIPWLLLAPLWPAHLPWREPLLLLALAVPAWLWMSVLWAPGAGIADLLDQGERLLYLVALFTAIGAALERYPRSERWLVGVILTAAGIGAAYSIAHHLHQHGAQLPRLMPASGITGNPIRAAWLFGAAAIWSLTLCLRAEKRLPALLHGLLTLLLLTAILLTKSRGPLLAFALAAAVPAWLYRHQVRRLAWLALPPLSVGVALLATTDLAARLIAREGAVGNYFNLGFRDVIWPAVWREILEDYWFGQGFIGIRPVIIPESGERFGHSHNFLLGTWRYAGVVGVVLVAAQLIASLRAAGRSTQWRARTWGAVLLFGILCSLTNGRMLLAARTEEFFIQWVPMAFIYAAVLRARRAAPSTPPQEPAEPAPPPGG